MKTVESSDLVHVFARSFEVLIDTNPTPPAEPAIGLKFNAINGEAFVVPMGFNAAKQLAALIVENLMAEAPELWR